MVYTSLNVDFLLAVSMLDSRGLTVPELFGSWTRWPRLPDASLTQGQNPEWKPLMFLTGCQPCFFLALFRSLSLCCSLPRSLPLSFSSLSLSTLLSPPLSLWFTLSCSPLCSSSDPLPHQNQDWHKAGPVSLWAQRGLIQNYVIFLERCGVPNSSVDSINQLQVNIYGIWRNWKTEQGVWHIWSVKAAVESMWYLQNPILVQLKEWYKGLSPKSSWSSHQMWKPIVSCTRGWLTVCIWKIKIKIHSY